MISTCKRGLSRLQAVYDYHAQQPAPWRQSTIIASSRMALDTIHSLFKANSPPPGDNAAQPSGTERATSFAVLSKAPWRLRALSMAASMYLLLPPDAQSHDLTLEAFRFRHTGRWSQRSPFNLLQDQAMSLFHHCNDLFVTNVCRIGREMPCHKPDRRICKSPALAAEVSGFEDTSRKLLSRFAKRFVELPKVAAKNEI